MSERPFCQRRVYGHNQPFGGAQCSHRAKAQYNGKWLCGVHAPEAEARRREKVAERGREQSRQWDERTVRQKYTAACVNALHSPDGRKIATEDIHESCFWQMADMIQELCEHGMVAAPGPHFRWDDDYYKLFGKARALLSALNLQEPEK